MRVSLLTLQSLLSIAREMKGEEGEELGIRYQISVAFYYFGLL